MFKDSKLQLQALYAIQELVHRLEHPTKLLHSILEELYDQKVISKESLLKWEKRTESKEQNGKELALKSCKPFFKWLKQADEEGVSVIDLHGTYEEENGPAGDKNSSKESDLCR